MATFIGELMARIGVDTRQLKNDMGKAREMFGGVGKFASQALVPLGAFAGVAGGIYGVAKAAEALVDATKLAARVEVMNHVLEMTGKVAGYTENEMKSYRDQIMALGIAQQEAIHIEQLFVQTQMDVADAGKLARAAQDLAVISGQNSSEAAETLTQAIVAQRPILLKQFGIIVSLEKIYGEMATTLGKTQSQLTEGEKRQAFFNEIMKQSATIAGSYETAMRDVGKQATSLPRYIDTAAEAVGEHFLPVMGVVVTATTNVLKAITEMFESTEAATSKFMASQNAFEQTSENTARLANRYDELTGKTRLNAAEQIELKKTIDDLMAIMPGAASQWDDASRVIGVNTDKIRKNIETRRALFRVQQADVVADWKKEWAEANEWLETTTSASYAKGLVQLSEHPWAQAQAKPLAIDKMLAKTDEAVAETRGRMNDLLVSISQGYDAVNDYARAEHDLGTEIANGLRLLQQSDAEAKKLRDTRAADAKQAGDLTVAQKKASENAAELAKVQVDAYKSIVDASVQSGAMSADAWSNYESARVRQIDEEIAKLRELGASEQMLASLRETKVGELRKQWLEGTAKTVKWMPNADEWFAAPDTKETDDLAQRQTDLYKQILEEGKVSAAKMTAVWNDYSALRRQQILDEAQTLRDAGASEVQVADLIALESRKLTEEQRAVFQEHGSWMREWAAGVANSMRESMQTFFFDVLTMKFASLRSALTSFLDSVAQSLAQSLSVKATDWVMGLIPALGSAGGSEVFGPDVSGMASGGIVRRPMLAYLGEQGPEAVIPLSRGKDRFMDKIAQQPSETSPGVTMNVATADVGSFKNSQSQLAAQLASAVNAARRNM